MTIPSFSDIKVKDYYPLCRQLSNGIKTYCFSNSQMDVVYMKIIFFNAGTISQEKFFTASLTKTLLSQGTRDYTSQALSDEMDFYGVNFSAVTSNEETSLGFSFLKQYQNEALPLIEQIVKYPLFEQDKLQVYVNKFRQQYLTKLKQSNFLAHKVFMQTLFGKNNPYGQYARVEDYDKVLCEDLRTFHQKRYSFNQCYIMLSGNVDEDFYSLLERYFGEENFNSTTADTSIRDFQPPENKAQKVITHLDTAVQASIYMGKLVPAIGQEDYIPLSVLNCLFGGFFSSRLMSNLREDKGYTYGIESVLAPFKHGNVMLIVSDITQGKDEETISEIYKEMQRLRTELVDVMELDLVKNYMIGDLLRSTDGVADICENYEFFVKYNLQKDYNSHMLKRVNEITPKDIMDLANKYYTEDSFVISVCKNTEN